MRNIKKTCLFMITIMLMLCALTGCNTREEKTIEPTSKSEVISESETPTTEPTEPKEEDKEESEMLSIVVYNPISQFSFVTSSEGYEDLTDMLNIKTNEIENENNNKKIVDNLFFIGTAYSMDLSKNFKVGDTITFIADTTQEPDTRCSIKSKNVTVTVNTGNAESTALSILKRYAQAVGISGKFKYEAINIQDSGMAYILNITAEVTNPSTITVTYNNTTKQYTVISTEPINNIHAKYEGFSATEGSGAVSNEQGTEFTITISEDNMVTIDKVK